MFGGLGAGVVCVLFCAVVNMVAYMFLFGVYWWFCCIVVFYCVCFGLLIVLVWHYVYRCCLVYGVVIGGYEFVWLLVFLILSGARGCWFYSC